MHRIPGCAQPGLRTLRDPAKFAEVRVVPEWGTIAWPNGADLDADVLYSRVTGIPITEAGDAGRTGERQPAG